MNKLSVGDYVRFEGRIFKLNEKWIEFFKLVKKDIKSSPNIIDLIEVGDYVNGYEVTSIDQFLGFGNHDWYMTNDEIKSIVTKEQFENISYKVGE